MGTKPMVLFSESTARLAQGRSGRGLPVLIFQSAKRRPNNEDAITQMTASSAKLESLFPLRSWRSAR